MASAIVNLTWNPVMPDWGLDYYIIYKDGAQVGVSTIPSYMAEQTVDSISTYTVSAVDTYGNQGPQSDVVVVNTLFIQVFEDTLPGLPVSVNKIVHYDHAGNALGEAFPNNLEWGIYLNKIGYVQYDLDLDHPLCKRSNTCPDITDFTLRRGVTDIIAGPHTAINIQDVEEHGFHVTGADWKHVLEGWQWPFNPTLPLASLYLVTARDVANIVNDLLTTIMAQANRLQLTVPAVVLFGQILDYKIDVADTQSLYEKFNDLAALASPYGFDWDILPNKTFTIYYPRRGIAGNFVFEINKNCKINNYSNMGIEGTHTLGLAQTPSGGQAGYQVDATNQVIYRRKDKAENFDNVKSLTQLQNQTQAASDRNSTEQLEFTVTYVPSEGEDVLAEIGLGDTATVVGDIGWDVINTGLRVVGIECKPTDTGDEAFDFTFDFGTLSL